jgi:hypothetical protein
MLCRRLFYGKLCLPISNPMKTYKYLLMLFGIAAVVFGCKKENAPELTTYADSKKPQLLAAAAPLPLTVTTVAGLAMSSGYADGVGKAARFNDINGIDVLDDGTIYVADNINNKIRKISPTYVVSTVNIPPSKDGQHMHGPVYVRVTKDGTINILTYDVDFVVQHKTWIVKTNGDVITPNHKPAPFPTNYPPYTYNDLEKDPYSNFLLISGRYSDHETSRPVIERFEARNNMIGTNAYAMPVDSLTGKERNNPAVTNFFCGYNGVKYCVMNYNTIYKLTPSGVFTRIYRNLVFHRITSIVGTKDSRTLYIADNGSIKAITNNRLVYLAGPHQPVDRGDGIGSSADVHAEYLGLSKDEGTLFFSDLNALRKMTLR